MKIIRNGIKFALVGLIFYFLFKNLITNWSQVESLELRFNIWLVGMSFIAIMLAWLMAAWSWGRVLKAFGYSIPYADVFSIYFKSNLGKYLPGKIWQIVGSAYYASTKGIPEAAAITTALIGQAYSVLSGLTLFSVALLTGLVKISGGWDRHFKVSAIPFLLVLVVVSLRPDLAQPVMNWIMRIFKRREAVIRLPVPRAIELFALYLLCWLLFGMGLWLFANALTPASIELYIPMTAILAAAVAIGFLALFAPGGLGVREGIIALFLAQMPSFPGPLPSAIAVGFRLLMTIAEVVAFGLTWMEKWIRKN